MMEFEPQTSGVGSDRSANSARTTVLLLYMLFKISSSVRESKNECNLKRTFITGAQEQRVNKLKCN